MIRFIKIGTLFLAILAIFLFALDAIITSGLKKTDIRKFQSWNDIYAHNINEDVIVIGNSRVWSQYDVQILDSIVGLSFYDLAIDGHTIDYQLIKYFTYRRFNKKPKYIIQNLDFFTFAIQKNGYEREQFFPYIKDDSLMQQVSKAKKITWIDRHIPFIRYYGYKDIIEDGFLAFLGKKDFFDGGMYKGYRGNEGKWNDNALNKIEKIAYCKEPEAIQLLEDFLQQCKQENIEVVLVSAPVYIEAKNKIENYSDLDLLFKNIARKYNCQLLDYTNESICFDTLNFLNATHMKKSGAELFSAKLGNDLKKIIEK